MIISKCPLRVSLVGGSTDLQAFIDKYGRGSVISFPCDLYTYIGINLNKTREYHINYSKTETVTNINDIKNDIAREVIKYFKLPPLTMIFNSDIPSTNSGLASSSSYIVAAVKCVDILLGLNLSQFEICKIALKIERKFNPLCGYQDPYGCGLPSLKRMDFTSDGKIKITPLNDKLLTDCCQLSLLPTNITRQSTNILSDLDVDKSFDLLDLVDKFENATMKNKWVDLLDSVSESWELKKKTSNLILNKELEKFEDDIKKDINILSYKLLGAGGGGYFLAISAEDIREMEIKIDNKGVQGWVI